VHLVVINVCHRSRLTDERPRFGTASRPPSVSRPRTRRKKESAGAAHSAISARRRVGVGGGLAPVPRPPWGTPAGGAAGGLDEPGVDVGRYPASKPGDCASGSRALAFHSQRRSCGRGRQSEGATVPRPHLVLR
jgi:hypothetical protein